MADRAGSLIGIRINGGPLTIKVTRASFDPENKHNRSVTTDASQAPRTIVTQGGGILRGTGYIDPSDTGSAFLLAAVGLPGGSNQTLTNIKYLIDTSEAGGSRHGYSASAGTLIIQAIDGQSDEAGMQEISFECHSTTPGFAYASNLT